MSLVDDLLRLGRNDPDRPAIIVRGDGDRETDRLNYGELTERVCGLAGYLGAQGLAGQPVVVALPAGLDYVVAILACMFAGAEATPMPEPPSRANRRWDAVMAHLRPAAIIAHTSVQGTPLLISPHAASDSPWTRPDLDDGDVAFIQYTSGSTSDPKGVMVTHAALAANRGMIRDSFQNRPDGCSVTWLPPYHDMGLVGGLLQPLGDGSLVVVLPPLTVVQRPLRWLKAISDYRAEVSGGPCFGFQACLDRIAPEAIGSLDLSSWQVAFCGAEPVRADTLETFGQRFAPAGFDPAALYPCYGLAEATLFVSGSTRGRGLKTCTIDRAALRDRGRAEPPSDGHATRTFAACGSAWGESRVVIRDPDTGHALADRQLGEIVVQGGHLARGYHRDAVATAATFTPDGLRTGDLGFVDEDELYVAGRLKDVVIVRGVKHHAEDLEAVAHGAHPALAPGAAAAFSIDDGAREWLVLAHEVARSEVRHIDVGAVQAAIRERLLLEAGVRPDTVILLKPGALPRTSSGKVQRRRCRDEFQTDHWPEARWRLGA